MRKGVLSVKTQLRSENYNLIWQRTDIEIWQWYKGFKKLPQGFYRVVLEASSSGRGEVDISLDDISIDACMPRAERSCAEDPYATDYGGVQDIAKSGKQCQPWNHISSYLLSGFLKQWGAETENSSLSELGNNCRNPNFDSNGPWCITDVNAMTIEYCKIPTCQCPKDSFTCKNGNCTSIDLQCDGKNDCGDNSDEFSDLCSKFFKLECSFENDWHCGYDSSESVTRDWSIVSSLEKSSYYSIKKGKKDDIVTLVSPLFKAVNDSCIYIDVKLTALVPVSLSLRDSIKEDRSRNYLCSLRKNDTDWHGTFIDIPSGDFRLVMDALASADFEFAMDNITLYGQNCDDTIEEANRIKNLKERKLQQIEEELELAKQRYYEELLKNRITTPNYNDTYNETTSNSTSDLETTENPTTIGPTSPTYEQTTNNITISVTVDPYNGLINETWIEKMRLNITNRIMADLPEAIPFGEKFCNKMQCINCLEPLVYETINDTIRSANHSHCNRSCDLSPTCPCNYYRRSSHSSVSWVIKKEIIDIIRSKVKNLTENSTEIDMQPFYRYYVTLQIPDRKFTSGTVDLIIPYRQFLEESCLQFNYVIYNIDVVAQKIDGSFDLLSLVHDQYLPVRHLAKVRLPIGFYRIEFRVRLSPYYPAIKNVRLDAIKITPGKCLWTSDEISVNCTFSNDDWCGYQDTSEGTIRWRRSKDDAKDDIDGYYIKTTGKANSIWQSAKVLSPWFNSTSYKIKITDVKPTISSEDQTTSNSTNITDSSGTGASITTTIANTMTTEEDVPTRFGRDVSPVSQMNHTTFKTTASATTQQEEKFIIINQSCITFAYFTQLNGEEGRSTLSVILINETNDRELAWRVHNTGDNEWRYGQFEIGVGYFRLEFQLSGFNTRGGIDEVKVQHGSCPSTFSKCLRTTLTAGKLSQIIAFIH